MTFDKVVVTGCSYVDKHKNEGWEWNGHPSEYANLDLGKRIINFLGEQYV